MDINNYVCNGLPTRREKSTFILKKAWIGIRQNLEYIQIFGSRINTFILNKKHTKSDIQKTWKGILIGYTTTSKYLRIWALQTYLVLITSKQVVNKGKSCRLIDRIPTTSD